ncbi:WXG100 family type VII secretion target [Nocardia sp. NPDC057353]|uniref:WXG100 family type VII secretion target n=1 Tax=Nocardia sp. NPDC057353 TaxID=3346104 RepID=UPI003645A2BE
MSDTGGTPVAVVPEKVREVGQYVYDLAETLRGALQSAARDVDRLTTESWTGDAAAEFATGWTDVRDGGTAIIDALAVLAEKLGVSAANYEKQESESATLLNM